MEDQELKKKKLRLHSCRRGLLEVELLLSAFARKDLDQLTAPQLEEFERLLEMEDLDLWETVCGRRPLPPDVSAALLEKIRCYLPEKPGGG